MEELQKKTGEVRVQYEEAGTGESQQNAHVERAIWEVEGLARTNVFAAEALHGVKKALDHPLRIWAIEYAGQMINRAQVSSKDGRQPTSCVKLDLTGDHYHPSARW